jgi:alanyl-tRNA synthetase
MTSSELRQKYITFFEGKGHTYIPSAPLVPENDPTTLFNSAGMQPLVPYLLGQEHPNGTKLVDYQKCIRTGDIDEVGDSLHHTFFEMLGNWSLGDYFKQESISWSYEFLTKELNIDPNRIWISVFAGDEDAPRDEEAAQLWQQAGIPTERIVYLGKDDNWWAAGPTGPCGPDTEIFFDTQKNDDTNDRPGSDTGRFVEIWNNVFMVYNRKDDGTLEELPKKNVDTGMGLERTLATITGEVDNYKTDLFYPIIKKIESELGVAYDTNESTIKAFRIIADHIKASTFLIKDGVQPSNKLQGYVLRRLLRRAAIKLTLLSQSQMHLLTSLVSQVFEIYSQTNYFTPEDKDFIKQIVDQEMSRFQNTLDKGLREVEKIEQVDGKIAFDLYQTYGFPLEITTELFREKGQEIDFAQFEAEFEKHKELSRTASAGMFKGGLSHHSEKTTQYHTATHLLHKALRDVLGTHVSQKGSNITEERLRFDFSHPEKLTDEQLKQVEDLVNEKIIEKLPVRVETMSKEEALNSGALAFFAEKYGDQVTVYSIGDNSTGSGYTFSKEICGGPHVSNTSELGTFKIQKEESAGAGIRRIYAVLN